MKRSKDTIKKVNAEKFCSQISTRCKEQLRARVRLSPLPSAGRQNKYQPLGRVVILALAVSDGVVLWLPFIGRYDECMVKAVSIKSAAANVVHCFRTSASEVCTISSSTIITRSSP